MSPRTVVELAASISEAAQHLTPEPIWVTGTLTTWKRSRSWTRGELTVYEGTNPAAKVQLGCRTKTAVAISKGFSQENKKLAAGIHVAVLGQLEFHPVYGMRLNVRTMAADSAKQSDTARARHDLISHLVATGIGSRQQQLQFPNRIRTIGLITPVSGDAARADALGILQTLDVIVDERRVPTAGPNAANAIRRSIAQLEPVADVIMCIRGGGSSADLTVWDDKRVVTAIGTCLRPVIVGVGHATDHLIATDVAYHGATTPTAAAQWIKHILTPPGPAPLPAPVPIHEPRDMRRIYIALAVAVAIILTLIALLVAQNF